MKKNFVGALKRINVARPICNHLVGEHHSLEHRVVGVLFMVIGVLIAKNAGHIDNMLLAVLGDGFGYTLHGLGLVPIIEAIASAE